MERHRQNRRLVTFSKLFFCLLFFFTQRGEACSSDELLSCGFDAVGNALAVWEADNGTSKMILAANKPIGEEWTTPVLISDPSNYSQSPVIAVSEIGEAVAIWLDANFTTHKTYISASSFTGGVWSPPVYISDSDGEIITGYDFAVQICEDGNIEAVWNVMIPAMNSSNACRSASGQIGSAWNLPITLS